MDWLVVQRKYPISLLWNSKQRQPVHRPSLEAPVKCKSLGKGNRWSTCGYNESFLAQWCDAHRPAHGQPLIIIHQSKFHQRKISVKSLCVWRRGCAGTSTAPFEMYPRLSCCTWELTDTHQAEARPLSHMAADLRSQYLRKSRRDLRCRLLLLASPCCVFGDENT